MTGSVDRADSFAAACAALLARHRRLNLIILGTALALGALVGAACLVAGITGAFGRHIVEGHRNPAAFILLVGPVALCWGVGSVVHHLVLLRREPVWRARLASRYALGAEEELPSLIPDRRMALVRWLVAAGIAIVLAGFAVRLLTAP